jgi:uncharacterized membrane protein
MRNVLSANVLLWIVQGLLALFFGLASGAPKFLFPPEMLNMPIPLPDAFLKLIGTAEILGALGLILPGITRVQPRLTSLAAMCLTLLTICAAVYQVLGHRPENAVFALIVGAFAGFVAYGRTRLAPLRGSQPHYVNSASGNLA